MSIEHSPNWVKEQVKTGLNLEKDQDVKEAIQGFTNEFLLTKLAEYKNQPFHRPDSPKDSAAVVLIIQKTLVTLGYKLPEHGIDGMMGTETTHAIKEFQIAEEIRVDGIPGPETFGSLVEVLKKQAGEKPKTSNVDQTKAQKSAPVASVPPHVVATPKAPTPAPTPTSVAKPASQDAQKIEQKPVSIPAVLAKPAPKVDATPSVPQASVPKKAPAAPLKSAPATQSEALKVLGAPAIGMVVRDGAYYLIGENGTEKVIWHANYVDAAKQ